jgi:hydroxyethylthiazole kinase
MKKVKEVKPLIHNITNYVTANECANVLLACGASPIMADDSGEVEDITSLCSGLNINMGTLNNRTISSMLLAGKRANKLKHPVLLDPVGVGASSLRNETAKVLLENIKFTVIRGNLSEIKMIASLNENKGKKEEGLNANSRGVDSAEKLDLNNLAEIALLAKETANKLGSIIAISGITDIITDGKRCFYVKNGHQMMAKITGSGCMLSALITAFISANKKEPLEATVAASCLLGIAGERAFFKMKEFNTGNSSYCNYLIDEVFKLVPGSFANFAKAKEVEL